MMTTLIGIQQVTTDDGSTNSNNNDDSNDGHSDAFRQFVTEAVLKLVEIGGEAGFSIKTCEDILKWGKDIHSQRDENAGGKWPLSWVYCLALLQDIGYKSATLYWICLDECHPCLYGLMEQKDEACPHCGKKGTIPYYYMSLIAKVKRWCSSTYMCLKMLAHWKQRHHWLPDECVCLENWCWPLKKEIWDGKRFAELAYFWDPNGQWILPVECLHKGCNTHVSANELLEQTMIDKAHERRRVICHGCLNKYL